MIARETKLKGVFVVELNPRSDERGTFAEVYNGKSLLAVGIDLVVDQVNVSRSLKRGTVRGMHFQTFPYGQKKLVRCVSGSAVDVIVDGRLGSPTYGEWVAIDLFPYSAATAQKEAASAHNNSAAAAHKESWKSVFIPHGCAHGWQAMEDNSEIEYCTEGLWNKEAERGFSPVDPVIRIAWPTTVMNVAARDLAWPAFSPSDPLS